MAHPDSHIHQTDREHTETLSHVMSLSMLFGVFFTLVVLTVLTVVAAQFSFGAWEVWVSLGIATVKGSLVVIYFMHLKYDKPFNTIVFISSIVFVGLFLALTLTDLHR